jgi:hypothetical protein
MLRNYGGLVTSPASAPASATQMVEVLKGFVARE